MHSTTGTLFSMFVLKFAHGFSYVQVAVLANKKAAT